MQKLVDKLCDLTKNGKLIWGLTALGYRTEYKKWDILLSKQGYTLSVRLKDQTEFWYILILKDAVMLSPLFNAIKPNAVDVQGFIDEILKEKE